MALMNRPEADEIDREFPQFWTGRPRKYPVVSKRGGERVVPNYKSEVAEVIRQHGRLSAGGNESVTRVVRFGHGDDDERLAQQRIGASRANVNFMTSVAVPARDGVVLIIPPTKMI